MVGNSVLANSMACSSSLAVHLILQPSCSSLKLRPVRLGGSFSTMATSRLLKSILGSVITILSFHRNNGDLSTYHCAIARLARNLESSGEVLHDVIVPEAETMFGKRTGLPVESLSMINDLDKNLVMRPAHVNVDVRGRPSMLDGVSHSFQD